MPLSPGPASPTAGRGSSFAEGGRVGAASWPDRAEDAVQDALLAAWKGLRALRDPDAWDAWLRRLVMRHCYRLAKKEQRRTQVELEAWRRGGDACSASAQVIEDNRLEDGTVIYEDHAGGTIIRRNTFTGLGAFRILSWGARLRSCKGNEISGRDFGIDTVKAGIVRGSGTSTVEGNTINGFEGNTITGPRTGIVIHAGASPTISGNNLDGLAIWIQVLGTETDAVIEGNRFCGNKQDLVGPEGASLSLDPSNEICADATAG